MIGLLDGTGKGQYSGVVVVRELVMRGFSIAAAAAVLASLCAVGARAQDPPKVPGVVTGGSGNTSIGGVPATRKGDATTDESAVVEDRTGCGGIVVGGGGGVFINGKPAARAGDVTTGCPDKK
jgi:uncharacterized Zn-binding protein involved in type VI secretion